MGHKTEGEAQPFIDRLYNDTELHSVDELRTTMQVWKYWRETVYSAQPCAWPN